jgi:hypothetical protein
VFFDPQFSKKGALLSASKAPKREKDPQDFAAVGEIYCPNALPMYRVSFYLLPPTPATVYAVIAL